MKKLLAAVAAMILSFSGSVSFAADDITVKYNGDTLCFNQSPVIINDKTLVQLRPIAEAMSLEIAFADGCVVLSDKKTTVVFEQDSNKIKVNDEVSMMDVPMILKNDYTFVPVRNLVEPFGNKIDYNGETKTVTILSEETSDVTEAVEKKNSEITTSVTTNNKKYPLPNEKEKADDIFETQDEAVKREIPIYADTCGHTYFCQSQPELALEAGGRGYCWVCSYAMLFSNATKKVITPIDIAQYNIDKGYNGNYMAGHEAIAESFGLKLVPALSEESRYYADFNTKNKGETTLLITSDEDAKAAICEAIDNFPYGVIVRYEGYPHSMLAVSYDDENIYFDDPGIKDGMHVTFENTCLKNYKLSDISFIQAVEVK